jgi:hypothetical protein
MRPSCSSRHLGLVSSQATHALLSVRARQRAGVGERDEAREHLMLRAAMHIADVYALCHLRIARVIRGQAEHVRGVSCDFDRASR